MKLYKRLKKANYKKPVSEVYLKEIDDCHAMVSNAGDSIHVALGEHKLHMNPKEARRMGRLLLAAIGEPVTPTPQP